MANFFQANQSWILPLATLVLGPIILKWLEKKWQAQERRHTDSTTIVTKQIDVAAQATPHLYNWWLQEHQENIKLLERATSAEAESKIDKAETARIKTENEKLAKQNAELMHENKQLATRANLIEWLEIQLEEHPESLRELSAQLKKADQEEGA